MAKLQAKQLVWCKHRSMGQTPVEAALSAGYTRQSAARLDSHPDCIAEVARLRGLPMQMSEIVGMMSRDEAILVLSRVARDEHAFLTARIQALKLLADLEKWTDSRAIQVGVQINLGTVEQQL